MPIQKLKTSTTIKKEHVVNLDRTDIIAALRHVGVVIPDKAEVTFYVPGGGDWSHTSIDIDSDNPVCVSWTDEEFNTEEA